ncbi:MAG: hypothetical protein WDZ28_03685 [Simkaniaceae bacterium]
MQNELKSLIGDFKTYLTEQYDPKSFVFGKPLQYTPLKKKKIEVLFTSSPPIQPNLAPPPAAPKKPPPKVEKKSPITCNAQKAPLPAPVLTPWFKLFAEIAPHLPLCQNPTSDQSAIRIKEAWREKKLAPEIAIFVSQNERSFKPFLENLNNALSACKGRSKLILVDPFEKENKWEGFLAAKHLKLILCPDALLFSLPNLLSQYTENPQKRLRSLGKTPLLLLPNLKIYAQDPALKRSLWNVLCQTLPS